VSGAAGDRDSRPSGTRASRARGLGEARPGWDDSCRALTRRARAASGRRSHDNNSLACTLGDGHGDGLLDGSSRGQESDQNTSHFEG